MQSALLLVAHGSRRAESNDEIRALAARLRSIATEQFNSVTCAFLETNLKSTTGQLSS